MAAGLKNKSYNDSQSTDLHHDIHAHYISDSSIGATNLSHDSSCTVV